MLAFISPEESGFAELLAGGGVAAFLVSIFLGSFAGTGALVLFSGFLVDLALAISCVV
jgi:hypothetical protein